MTDSEKIDLMLRHLGLNEPKTKPCTKAKGEITREEYQAHIKRKYNLKPIKK